LESKSIDNLERNSQFMGHNKHNKVQLCKLLTCYSLFAEKTFQKSIRNQTGSLAVFLSLSAEQTAL
jgi:hypothetical protein